MSRINHFSTSAPDAQLYVRILENVEEAVAAIDLTGKITLFNPAAQSFTGISEKQALGRSFKDLFSGQDKLLYLISSTIRELRPISDYEEVFLERPLAPPLPVSVSVAPIFSNSGEAEGVVLLLRDLSHVRELEEAVRHADRLSMLGTLAAGLAHEIKNPLAGIKGAAQLLSMELSSDSTLQEYTRVMMKETERVNTIIEELMALSRPRPPQINETNLSKILGDLVLLQKEAYPDKSIEFELKLDPSIPPIHGDEKLLKGLLLNLIKNAAEAIVDTGRVEVCTKVASEYHLNKQGDRPVPLIQIEIRDNGKGIASEDLDRIFTPFFTSKTEGTGLGLAICQKIVSDHEGFLKVESTPGQGTVFTVLLPLFH